MEDVGVNEDVLAVGFVEDHACAVDCLLLFDHVLRVLLKVDIIYKGLEVSINRRGL
jgi:hypothetical protein